MLGIVRWVADLSHYFAFTFNVSDVFVQTRTRNLVIRHVSSRQGLWVVSWPGSGGSRPKPTPAYACRASLVQVDEFMAVDVQTAEGHTF